MAFRVEVAKKHFEEQRDVQYFFSGESNGYNTLSCSVKSLIELFLAVLLTIFIFIKGVRIYFISPPLMLVNEDVFLSATPPPSSLQRHPL